jgi:hypothetical protein
MNAAAKEALRTFDENCGNTLKEGGVQVRQEKKRKGFRDKLKDL